MLTDIFKVLSHPVRLELIKLLATRQSCLCREIPTISSFSKGTILSHLRALKQAGLVQGELEGAERCYQLNADVLQQFKQQVSNL